MQHKESLMYVVMGVSATVFNWGIYSLLVTFLPMELANAGSFAMTLIFAYVTNKIYVFESRSWGMRRVLREFCAFATARKRVEKVSSIERVKTNVAKETGDAIRAYGLSGVKVDEDFKRYYPYGELASQVLGFTGGDNQGIIGLEVKYEEYLKGVNGTILTMTDARGIELEGVAEDRMEPKPGNTLEITMDYNIQSYCEQAAKRVMEEKEADAVAIILMDPQNGEIYAMANVPKFNLNDPFTLSSKIDTSELTDEKKQDLLNQMWRNRCINDTYEPGSTFKIVTATAGLEEGVVSLDSTFSCPGYRMVEDRRIKCHKTTGHGSETFVQATMNSCNPVLLLYFSLFF